MSVGAVERLWKCLCVCGVCEAAVGVSMGAVKGLWACLWVCGYDTYRVTGFKAYVCLWGALWVCMGCGRVAGVSVGSSVSVWGVEGLSVSLSFCVRVRVSVTGACCGSKGKGFLCVCGELCVSVGGVEGLWVSVSVCVSVGLEEVMGLWVCGSVCVSVCGRLWYSLCCGCMSVSVYFCVFSSLSYAPSPLPLTPLSPTSRSEAYPLSSSTFSLFPLHLFLSPFPIINITRLPFSPFLPRPIPLHPIPSR